MQENLDTKEPCAEIHEDDADDSLPTSSSDSRRTFRRALVLAAVVCRGNIESYKGQSEAELLHTRILKWLTDVNLWDEVEPAEEKILRAPLGELEQKDVIAATWCVEGLALLAWALHLLDFPTHDEKVNAYEVAEAVSFLSEAVEEIMRTVTLRSLTELEISDEFLYVVHTRLRNFIREKTSKNFTSWIEKSWTATLGIEEAHLIVQNDLAIDGSPIVEANQTRVEECASIVYQRHKAMTWILEQNRDYSQTSVSA